MAYHQISLTRRLIDVRLGLVILDKLAGKPKDFIITEMEKNRARIRAISRRLRHGLWCCWINKFSFNDGPEYIFTDHEIMSIAEQQKSRIKALAMEVLK